MNWLVNLWHWLSAREAVSFFTAAHAGSHALDETSLA